MTDFMEIAEVREVGRVRRGLSELRAALRGGQ